MSDKKSFVLYSDYQKHICKLSDEDAGKLFKALFQFVNDGTEPVLSDSADMAFSFISDQLQRDQQKWSDTCEKRRTAGQRGGKQTQANQAKAPSASGDQANQANASFASDGQANQANASFASGDQANQADTVTDTDNENVTVTENENDTVTENDTAAPAAGAEALRDGCAAAPSPSKSKPKFHVYGQYRNVHLSAADLTALQTEFPHDWSARIEDLSAYIAQSGKRYKNHLATIRNWAKRDSVQKRRPDAPAVSQPDYDPAELAALEQAIMEGVMSL